MGNIETVLSRACLLSFCSFCCSWNYVVWFSNYPHRIIWSHPLSMGSGILSARNISKS
ncbi:hypothetical protein Pint_14951 [Pistacia integerrima]|uniref:Uncharacterized protein n=1 Tax=Pistacia integerrima TaxID=434235 RepID=A0ACC0ZGV0_9ROSI|nr:hypothetical protein Pint_14951 [Pistacia integerrima]